MLDPKLEQKIRYGAAGIVVFFLIATIIKIYLGEILFYLFVILSFFTGFFMIYKLFLSKPFKKSNINPPTKIVEVWSQKKP